MNGDSDPERTAQPLQSGILESPADAMLSAAIAAVLEAPVDARIELFARLTAEIESYVTANAPERPWTCRIFRGTDGSTIFRGGVGHSLVIDPHGRLWRARSYEDFLTTYTLTTSSCDIETLTPLYDQMREYQRRV